MPITTPLGAIHAELLDIFDEDRARAIADLVDTALTKHIGGPWGVVAQPAPIEPITMNDVIEPVRADATPQAVFRICKAHAPKQHRDGKPPWCQACGRTVAGIHHTDLPMIGHRP